ncbi:metal-dependent transcriptional regulator [Halobellus sp. GM3]|uniref:metal-dependent transcriptional regulator n=1 Tax=Halobellus sp. GM3 TaxID=3458410 RepID=UPI00403E0A96
MTGKTAQYLVVIYALEEMEGPPVRSGRIARLVDRSPSATTEMIQRLAENGLVEHEPYTGVELTEEGRERAAGLYETHVTFCRFFRDVLELDDYAREALLLAGVVDREIAKRLEGTILPPDDVRSKPIRLLPSDHSNSADGEPQKDTSPGS